MFRLFTDPAEEAAYKKWQELEPRGHISHENKRRIFGYAPNDMFGFFEHQARYFKWRTEIYPNTPERDKPKELLIMGMAAESLFPAAQVHTGKHPSTEETTFIEQTEILWAKFRKKNGETINMRYDAACEIFFTHVSDLHSREIIVDPFNFCPIRLTLELTYLFHINRERCSSLEHARKFDRAYLVLFSHRCGPDISYADHPYSPVLEGTLNVPLPLPGVDIELTAPVVVTVSETVIELEPMIEQEQAAPVETITEPVLAEAPQEEVVEAPALSSAMARPFVVKPREKLPPEALSGNMTIGHARKVFDYAEDEIPKQLDLMDRYKNFISQGLPAVVQEEIDVAFGVLMKIAA